MPHLPSLKVHHFGCLTSDIGKSLSSYAAMGFVNVSKVYTVSSQKVDVCFVDIGNGVYIELVKFSDGAQSLKKIFESKNPYYHIGYLVEDISASISILQHEGFYLVNRFNSEAFDGKPCAFMYTPDMQLIELIQT